MDFQVIDWVFVVLIVLMLVHGFIKGFISELFSWAALVLGILAAVFLHRQGAELIREHAMRDVKYVPEILAFAAVFLVVWLICKLLQRLLKDIIKGAHLGSLDKVLGAVFGLVEGFTLAALVLFVLSVQPLFDASTLLENSVFAQIILPRIPEIPFDKGKKILDAALLDPRFSPLVKNSRA